MSTPTQFSYLKTINKLTKSGAKTTTIAAVAEACEVTTATARTAILRFAEKKLVSYKSYGPGKSGEVGLSAAGKKVYDKGPEKAAAK